MAQYTAQVAQWLREIVQLAPSLATRSLVVRNHLRGGTRTVLRQSGGPSQAAAPLIGDRYWDSMPPQAPRHGEGTPEIPGGKQHTYAASFGARNSSACSAERARAE